MKPTQDVGSAQVIASGPFAQNQLTASTRPPMPLKLVAPTHAIAFSFIPNPRTHQPMLLKLVAPTTRL